MNINLKIKTNSIQSFLVLFSCCGIEYINSFMPFISKGLFVLRIALIGIFLLSDMQNMKRTSHVMWIVNLFCGYIILVSLLNRVDILYVFRSLSVPYLMAYYIDLQAKKSRLYNTIKIWENYLLVLVILDLITMILFPNGLYNTDIYSLNWFLGYKTARFPFVILTCILAEIIARKENKFFKAKAAYLVSFITVLKSSATAALLSFGFMAAILIISRQQNREHKWKQKILSSVLDYRLIIPAYGFVTFMTIVANASPIMVNFIESIGKDPTLTTRTYIWANAVKLIKNSIFFGYGYLTPDQYRQLLGSVFFSSPHNMVLSLLMIGGVVCLLLYLILVVETWKKSKFSQVGFICTIGMLAMLFVGITSSTMLFTLSGFAVFVLSSDMNLISNDFR